MKPMWWPHGTTLNRVFRMWVLNNVKIMMWKIVCLWLFGDRIGLVPVQVLACCRMCVEVLAKTRAWGLKLSHCLNGSGQVKLSVRQAKFWNDFCEFLRKITEILEYTLLTFFQLMISLAKIGPPPEGLDQQDCPILHGLAKAIELLCQPSTQQTDCVNSTTESAEQIVNRGRIVCLTMLKRYQKISSSVA